MTEEKQEQERTRKVYAPKGERGQKMFSFRLDNENAKWLQMQPNRGRYINELIAADHKRQQDSDQNTSQEG